MRWKSVLVICFSLGYLLTNLEEISSAKNAEPISQYQINEMAAALLTARRDILESGHLRTAEETAPAYCSKIAKPLPTESNEAYNLRLSAYEKTLEKLAGTVLQMAKLPKLQNSSLSNIAVWDSIYRQLNNLPVRLQKVHKSIEYAKKKHDSISFKSLGYEFLATIRFDMTVYDLLRDALP